MSFALAEGAVEVAEQAAETAGAVADGRLDLRGFGNVGTSVLDALLGYAVVFIGLTLLMLTVIIVGKIMALFDDDETRLNLGLNAAYYAREKCDYSKVIPQLEKIIGSDDIG